MCVLLRPRDRIIAGLIGLILVVTAIDMVGESPIIAVGAAVMVVIGLRMAQSGRCGWGAAPTSCGLPEHDLLTRQEAAEPAAGKD